MDYTQIEILSHKFFELIYNWPPTDRYTLISLLISLASLYLTWITTKGAVRAAINLNFNSSRILENSIFKGLEYPELLTLNRLKSLAFAIEQQTSCPAITDKVLEEILRKVHLDLEDRYEGAELARRLKLLNDLLEELNPKAVPFLSIADTDRILGFQLSIMAIALSVFGLQLLLSIFQLSNLIITILFYLGFFVFFYLIISNYRAIMIWSDRGLTVNRYYDLFLSIANSRSSFNVNVLWAPIWEGLAFHLLPMFMLPMVSFFIIIQFGKISGVNASNLYYIAASGLIVSFFSWYLYQYIQIFGNS